MTISLNENLKTRRKQLAIPPPSSLAAQLQQAA